MFAYPSESGYPLRWAATAACLGIWRQCKAQTSEHPVSAVICFNLRHKVWGACLAIVISLAVADCFKLSSVVAVHGLGANPDMTWECKPEIPKANASSSRQGSTSNATADVGVGKIVNWLKDSNMLPKALPRARIMRWGYNSAWFGPGSIDVRVGEIAESLLQDLFYAREVRISLFGPLHRTI